MRIKNNYNRKHIYFLTLHKILQNLKPRLWILVGVTLYGDTLDMNKLKKKYDQQKNHLSFLSEINSGETGTGTWDDHDYGIQKAKPWRHLSIFFHPECGINPQICWYITFLGNYTEKPFND